MADNMEGKKLTELRVIDLKTELERRGLDKTGNKAALLERLSKVGAMPAKNSPSPLPRDFSYMDAVRASRAILLPLILSI